MASLIPVSGPRQAGLIFAYLAVRPRLDCPPDISVEYVQNGNGDLSSKMRAKNDCVARSQEGQETDFARWKVLVGFYTHSKNWKRRIKPKWSQCKAWELALLSGLRLANKYGVDNVLYVSSEAQSEPQSALLHTLQQLSSDEQGSSNVRKNNDTIFWKVVMSTSNSLSQLKNILLKDYPESDAL